jgi:hypothetical protein
MMCIIFLMGGKKQNIVLAHLDLLWDVPLAAVFTNRTFLFSSYSDFQVGTSRRFRKITTHFSRDNFTGCFLSVRTTRMWFVYHTAGFFILQKSANHTEEFYCIFDGTTACLWVQSSYPYKIMSTRKFKIHISKMSRHALGFTQTRNQWVLGLLLWG